MRTSTNRMVGETADLITQAEAKRARLLPMLPELCAQHGLSEAQQSAVLRRINRANSAAWWLQKVDDRNDHLFWSCANTMLFDQAQGSVLPPDFYSPNAIAARQKETAAAVYKAKFLDLPALSGSEKQIAWALTLRAKFIEKYSHYDEPEVNAVLALKDAKTSRFWIDQSKERGQSWKNEYAPSEMFEHMTQPGWAEKYAAAAKTAAKAAGLARSKAAYAAKFRR